MKTVGYLKYAVIFLAVSCLKEDPGLIGDGTAVAISFNAGDFGKSSFVASENAVDNVCIGWYEDGKLAGTTLISGSEGNIQVQPGNYEFYAVANMGGFEFPEMENGLPDAVWSAPVSSFSGIPMASGPVSYSAPLSGKSISFLARRLAAKFRFSVDASNLPGTFSITSFRIRQNSSRILPFSYSSKALSPSDVSDSDHASAQDISALNSGGTISLYAFENIQGVHPEIDRPEKKCYDYIRDNVSGTLASTATYLEVSGTWYGNAISAPVTYRMYLGANPGDDFNVIGNKLYNISLSFETDPVEQFLEEPLPVWKMSVSDPDDSREVSWDNDSPFILPGGDEMLFFNVSPPGTEYEVEVEDGVDLVDGETVRGESGIYYYLDREGGYIEIFRDFEDVSSGIITCNIRTPDGLNSESASIYKLGFNNTVSYFAFSDDYSTPISDCGTHDWDYDFSDIVFVSDFNPYSTEMTSVIQDNNFFTDDGKSRILFRICDYYYNAGSDRLAGVYNIDFESMKENNNLYVWLWNMSERNVGKSISVDMTYYEAGILKRAGSILEYHLRPYTGKMYPIRTSSTWSDTFYFDQNFYRSGSQYYYPVAALDQCIISAYSPFASEAYADIGEGYITSSGSIPAAHLGSHTSSYDSDGLVSFNVFHNYAAIPSSGVDAVTITIN